MQMKFELLTTGRLVFIVAIDTANDVSGFSLFDFN